MRLCIFVFLCSFEILCIYGSLFLYVSLYEPIYRSIYLSFFLSINPSVHESINLASCQPINLSSYQLSSYQPFKLSIYQPITLSLYQCIKVYYVIYYTTFTYSNIIVCAHTHSDCRTWWGCGSIDSTTHTLLDPPQCFQAGVWHIPWSCRIFVLNCWSGVM